MYGVVEYIDGNPVCEICGKSFKRLMTHVRQKHNMSAIEYKKKFGLNTSKGIISDVSRELSRKRVEENRHVLENIIEGGKKTRYSKGHEGRTKDKVSEQERLRLSEQARTNISTEKRKELGTNLGKSGLGNQKRWSKK